MFGSNNPLNAKHQALVLRDFDSAAAEIKTSVSALTSSVREELKRLKAQTMMKARLSML